VENRYFGILPGESYIGIRALADFFLFAFKIPNSNHGEEDATWETEDYLKEVYKTFFKNQ